jgi:hypothetical protein
MSATPTTIGALRALLADEWKGLPDEKLVKVYLDGYEDEMHKKYVSGWNDGWRAACAAINRPKNPYIEHIRSLTNG